jgi:hypothetical protein
MPKIFDNIENYLTKGLSDSLEVSHRSDFCVGYFNLRGWKEVADKIDLFAGKDNEKCRLLIGMHKQPEEILREYFSTDDADEVDELLAEHYGFTQEELDFIINYDIKYRMGKELEEEDE